MTQSPATSATTAASASATATSATTATTSATAPAQFLRIFRVTRGDESAMAAAPDARVATDTVARHFGWPDRAGVVCADPALTCDRCTLPVGSDDDLHAVVGDERWCDDCIDDARTCAACGGSGGGPEAALRCPMCRGKGA